MSDRDELAKLVVNRDEWDAADAILAAGWRPPARTVTTVEELDALAVGSVVFEGDHATPDDTGMGFSVMPGVFHRFPDGWYVVAGYGPRDVPLPATVLWGPGERTRPLTRASDLDSLPARSVVHFVDDWRGETSAEKDEKTESGAWALPDGSRRSSEELLRVRPEVLVLWVPSLGE